MGIYPLMSILAVVVVLALELLVFRSGVMRTKAFWIAMIIIFGFMIPVDGWLTKLSAPIVTYRASDTSGLRPIWNIPLEEFAYAFALCTLVIVLWDRSAKRDDGGAPAAGAASTDEPLQPASDESNEVSR